MHPHQAGKDGAIAQIEVLRIGRRLVGELAAGDVEGLILARRRAGAVDDAHVLQDQRGRVDLDEGLQGCVGREQERDEHGGAL